MDDQLRKELQKKRVLYTNIIYIIYLIIVLFLVLLQASALVVYSLLGMIFLLSPLGLWFMKSPNPLLLLFPGMNVLLKEERGRLGEVGRTYYLAGTILQLLLSGFCFFQGFVRGSISFLEGIPWWYLLVVAVLLIYIGNLDLRFHIRRLEQKNKEELIAYAKDRALFSMVFGGVLLFFIVAGAIYVLLVS